MIQRRVILRRHGPYLRQPAAAVLIDPACRLSWPSSLAILICLSSTTTEFDREFDYIIIGAGTAGCVIASRLSEDPANRVCLIEAGGSNRHPFIEIPAAVGAAIMSPKFGWGLSTVPQQHLDGRRVPLPRGRVIGGTGSINGMAYFRGPAKDFDDWAAAGNPGWSYADLLPYFLRSEHNPEYAGSPYHATGGPMGVSFPTSRNRLCDAFNASMASLGYKELPDFNVPDPNGYGYRQGTIWKGRRVSTASAYLKPAMTRRNLEVLTETRTRRVLLDGKRAVGVEVQTRDGIKRFAARKEVVVSCGTFHSPHLLLHSGIGDERDLKSWGITPVHHLPAVGRHLRDHPAAPIAMETDDPRRMVTRGRRCRATSRRAFGTSRRAEVLWRATFSKPTPISGRCRTPTGRICSSCSSPRGGTRGRFRFRSATALRSSACVSIPRARDA